MSSDRNERIIKIISENLGNFKEQATIVFQLDKEIQNKLKNISNKLIPFMAQNCKEEYKNLLQNFKIVESSTYGSQIIPINKDNKENKGLLNKVERCIDRHTGLNKLITMYEVDSRNTIYEDDTCKRKCINDSSDMDDTRLTECFTKCYEKYYNDIINLSEDFEAKLNKINLSL
jgi:hypothetical protein